MAQPNIKKAYALLWAYEIAVYKYEKFIKRIAKKQKGIKSEIELMRIEDKYADKENKLDYKIEKASRALSRYIRKYFTESEIKTAKGANGDIRSKAVLKRLFANRKKGTTERAKAKK